MLPMANAGSCATHQACNFIVQLQKCREAARMRDLSNRGVIPTFFPSLLQP